MERKLVLRSDISAALDELGLGTGDVVMVHCSLGSFGFVCGGAQTVIEALTECVGPQGTVMMPAQSWKNLDPESGVHWQEPREWWQAIRDNWPAYDTLEVTGEDFAQIGEAFEREHRVSRTICGSAGLRLMRQRELVDFAVAWIEANRR